MEEEEGLCSQCGIKTTFAVPLKFVYLKKSYDMGNYCRSCFDEFRRPREIIPLEKISNDNTDKE